GPIIVYSGAVDDRIDFPLVAKVAQKLPDVNFVFIGPCSQKLKTNQLPNNVKFIGEVQHEELPDYLRSADAGMIPFDVTDGAKRVSGVRPLKMLEYMSAGLPVITASWSETEALPVWCYRNADEFV